jgi:hypothetical protein
MGTSLIWIWSQRDAQQASRGANLNGYGLDDPDDDDGDHDSGRRDPDQDLHDLQGHGNKEMPNKQANQYKQAEARI